MKKVVSFLAFVLVVLLGWCVQAAPLDAAVLRQRLESEVIQAEIPQLVPSPGLKLIARSTVSAVLRHHYSKPRLNPSLNSQWFDNYFQWLDPQKIYFLQSDLEEFRNYEPVICMNGLPNLDFAFLVYQRYLERLREWCVYTFQAYDRPCEFTVDESLELFDKPEDHDWAATRKEREDLWRKRVKNALLIDQLTKEELAARGASEASTEGVTGEEGQKKVVYTPPPIRLRNQNVALNTFQYRLNAEPIEVLGGFLNAFCSLVDPHTCYYVPVAKEDFDIQMSLSLQGIGATLTWRDSYTVVLSLVPGGPAARDGHLKPGDKILAVAQSPEEEPLDVVDMPLSKVVTKIRGPKGTDVYLTIQPEGASTVYVLKLTRDEIKLKDAEAQSTIHMVDGKRVLCIYLPSFYRDFEGYGQKANAKSSTRDVLRLLAEAQEGGPVDGVILDMRDNGGGSLEEAIQLSSAFLQSGTDGRHNSVVQTRDKDGVVTVRQTVSSAPAYSGPLMMMVDRGAASATEILAACLQDTGRAVIVGDPGTHGKGSVQTILDVGEMQEMRRNRSLLGGMEPGSVKVTIQKFYRVTGGSTQIRGVTPDICFPSFNMASKTSEADLPHVLPWDEIPSAYFRTQTALSKYLPELQDFYHYYSESNAAFRQYRFEVEEYLRKRENKSIPLEIQARRAYQEWELQSIRRIRHYTPQRTAEDQERLHDADEDLYEDGGPREDVILDAALSIMGEMLEIDDREDQKAFSIVR